MINAVNSVVRSLAGALHTSDAHDVQPNELTDHANPQNTETAGVAIRPSPTKEHPITQRRPSLPKLPSDVIDSDASSISAASPPRISFSPVDKPAIARRSTVELDDWGRTSPESTVTSSGQSLSARSNSTSDTSPSSVEGFKRHRRTWSASVPREIKETPDASTSEDPEKGTRTLNQYDLGDEIGKGSFGYVWRAVDRTTGIEYAIKECSKSRLRRQAQAASMRAARKRDPSRKMEAMHVDDGLRLIEHEVAIMKKLKHVNIVSLHEVLDDKANDSIFMVLELCKGGPIMHTSMTEVAASMPEPVALNYFRQLLLAIEYLHSLDICHSDLKPENVLISGEQGTAEAHLVKLGDFGVSQLFAKSGHDLSARSVGSPAFLSPEQNISQHGELHQRASDIWALGVTLYVLLTGMLPFRSTNSLELAELIKTEPAAIPRSLTPHARNILARLLDKDPKTRIGLDELREHPWTTEAGSLPLPSKTDNCSPISETTEEDVENALQSLSSAASAVRVAQQLRRLAASSRRTVSAERLPPSRDNSLTNTPDSTDTPTHQDDHHVAAMRYVEEQTGQMIARKSVDARRSASQTSHGST